MDNNLPQIRENVAGIDLGSDQFFVALPSGEVHKYPLFTGDIARAIELFKEEGVEEVAMEATGVYWIPLLEMLEEVGIGVCLVNGAHCKNVPGRKSDVQDCQWIQQLFSCGLLRKSFVPSAEIRVLRSFVRLRDDHIRQHAMHVQHMQKALDLMNIKLHKVIDQIQGMSGLRVIEAILSGNHNPEQLVELCHDSILKKKREAVVESLRGHYREEHLFALQHALNGYRFYQRMIAECDAMIERWLHEHTTHLKEIEVTTKPKPIRHHKPDVKDLHQCMVRLGQGNDAGQLPGLTDHSWLKLTSELGTDMSAWPTPRHFVAWLGLSGKRETSGKKKRRRRMAGYNKAGQIFRESAQSMAESKYLALGAFYRRIRSRRGPRVANTATARKLAIMYYNLMTHGKDYIDRGVEEYERQQNERRLRNLHRMAKKYGFQLLPTQEGQAIKTQEKQRVILTQTA
jgi:transposase